MIQLAKVSWADLLVDLIDEVGRFEVLEVIVDSFAALEREFFVDPGEQEGWAVIIAAKHLVFY